MTGGRIAVVRFSCPVTMNEVKQIEWEEKIYKSGRCMQWIPIAG